MPVLEETRYCKIENVGETGFKNNTRFARASKATVIENGLLVVVVRIVMVMIMVMMMMVMMIVATVIWNGRMDGDITDTNNS